jgi:hypothetical protein
MAADRGGDAGASGLRHGVLGANGAAGVVGPLDHDFAGVGLGQLEHDFAGLQLALGALDRAAVGQRGQVIGGESHEIGSG